MYADLTRGATRRSLRLPLIMTVDIGSFVRLVAMRLGDHVRGTVAQVIEMDERGLLVRCFDDTELKVQSAEVADIFSDLLNIRMHHASYLDAPALGSFAASLAAHPTRPLLVEPPRRDTGAKVTSVAAAASVKVAWPHFRDTFAGEDNSETEAKVRMTKLLVQRLGPHYLEQKEIGIYWCVQPLPISY